MAANGATTHRVTALNLSAASENRIHDDETARRLGFRGGLVAGVEVYAYMTNPAVRLLGREWLERGTAECRLVAPVYDGREAVATAEPDGAGGLSLRVESDGALCAAGAAALAPEPAADTGEGDPPVLPLPDADARPDASPASLPEGRALGTFALTAEPDAMAEYLAGARETLGLYAAEGIVHPAWVLRLANRAVSANVRLGPWIHVGSRIRNRAPARYGDRLLARARVARNYERKGHLFVEVDVLVAREDGAALVRIDHTAIYRPRQVAEAA